MARKYRLTYTVKHHPEGTDAVPPGGEWGACDQIVYLAINQRRGMSRSNLLSCNGLDIERGMSPLEIFRHWVMMGKILEGQLQGMPQAIAGDPLLIAMKMGGLDRVEAMNEPMYTPMGMRTEEPS